ncbi:hypothetical protein O6H91_19G073100 [Diphasiastrum complanatum]|uniref:Uncharacterized protein n=2 Tax=Diphasiastrum complanatum TaxID=34168 RepID=A0ACC2AWH9_DIPCM|nr:hypothetical protein O6H91_19G073100 [Diphasiastrum complanatum]KAJ7521884.1 hypothetical protein O6H91_19G073100 [Diphasiastrum complanatum]
MGGCLGVSFVKLDRIRKYWRFRLWGLHSELRDLNDGTTMHCWVPAQRQSTVAKKVEKPVLLLIHGFGVEGMSSWEEQVPIFSKHYDLYIPDLLFFGKSFTTNSQRTEIYQAECMYKMLDQLHVNSGVFVVGLSYGGFVGFHMANMYPELVKKLVIVDSGICMDPSTNDDTLKEFNASHIHEVIMSNKLQVFKKSVNRAMYKQLRFVPDFIFEGLIKVHHYNEKQRIELLDELTIGSKNSTPLPQLTKQDVLIVWGEQDRVFKLDLAHKLEKHMRGTAELVVIPECGHMPPMEKPTLFNSCLLSFLQQE